MVCWFVLTSKLLPLNIIKTTHHSGLWKYLCLFIFFKKNLIFSFFLIFSYFFPLSFFFSSVFTSEDRYWVVEKWSLYWIGVLFWSQIGWCTLPRQSLSQTAGEAISLEGHFPTPTTVHISTWKKNRKEIFVSTIKIVLKLFHSKQKVACLWQITGTGSDVCLLPEKKDLSAAPSLVIDLQNCTENTAFPRVLHKDIRLWSPSTKKTGKKVRIYACATFIIWSVYF